MDGRAASRPSSFFASEEGFTYLELLVATILLAISVLAVVQMLGVGAKGSAQSKIRTLATQRALYLAEDVRLRGYQNIPTDATETGTYAPPGSRYVLQQTVRYVSTDANNDGAIDDADLKVVTVTVDWSEPQPSKPVKVTSYIVSYRDE